MPATPATRSRKTGGLRSRSRSRQDLHRHDSEENDKSPPPRPPRQSSRGSRRHPSLDEDGEDSNDSLADPQRPSSLDPVDELAAGGEASAHGGVLADMAQYFTDEVFQGYEMDSEASEMTEMRAIRALQVPLELEKFIALGITLCLNCFLEFATYLPLRAVYALVALPFSALQLQKPAPGMVRDLLRCALVIVSSYLHLQHVDVSQAYHWIRGELQSIIKLYVLFNVFDIVDKLFCSFGQDILDTLFYHASYKTRGVTWASRFVLYFAVATAYVCLHSWITLMQYVILNVAVNSANNALLTIVISNQFVELKGSVFKRSGQGNLFQVSCSDIRERFHFCCLLLLVLVRNMVAKRWDWAYFYDTLLPAVMMVYVSEVIVDNAKHVFVTRFNNLDPSIYQKFRRVLWKDIAGSSTSQGLSLKVVRRMGFTPIPLLSLFYIVLSTTVPITGNTGLGWTVVVGIFCGLLVLKVLIGIILRRIVASKVVRQQRGESPPNPDYDVRFPMERVDKPMGGEMKPDVPLDQVNRFTMMSRIS